MLQLLKIQVKFPCLAFQLQGEENHMQNRYVGLKNNRTLIIFPYCSALLTTQGSKHLQTKAAQLADFRKHNITPRNLHLDTVDNIQCTSSPTDGGAKEA